MYDPKTVAFELPGITIWHVDPETDGTDDSCGFAYPKVPVSLANKLTKNYIATSFRDFFSESCHETLYAPRFTPLEMIMGIYMSLVRDFLHQGLRTKDLLRIIYLVGHTTDHLRWYVDGDHYQSFEEIQHLYWCLMRQILYVRRPWWRHPKWHIHHWSIQVHPWQLLKRWLFSRCMVCGKRFRWKETPYSSNIESTNWPWWYIGKRDIYHEDCIQTFKKMRTEGKFL